MKASNFFDSSESTKDLSKLCGMLLTHFKPMFHFHTHWNHQKTRSLLMFSLRIEIEHWLEMGWRLDNCQFQSITQEDKTGYHIQVSFSLNFFQISIFSLLSNLLKKLFWLKYASKLCRITHSTSIEPKLC